MDVKVSVIIPVYNEEKNIAECLESVIKQTLKEIEIICVDDGSNDNSVQIIEKYCLAYPWIRLMLQKNQGAGVARNNALSQAKGQFVCFLDADDYYISEDALEILYNTAVEEKVNICAGLMQIEYEGKLEKEPVLRRLLSGKEMRHIFYQDFQYDYQYVCYIYNRNLLKQYDIKFPLYRRFQDPPFLVQALFYAREFVVVRTEFYFCRAERHEYTDEQIYDLFAGLMFDLKFSWEKGLEKLFEITLNRINEDYFEVLYSGLERNIQHLRERFVEAEKLVKEANLSVDPLDMTLLREGERRSNAFFDNMEAKVAKNINIIIYGAGIVGKKCFLYLSNTGYAKVTMWIDHYKCGTDCYSQHLYDIEDIVSADNDDKILIAIKDREVSDKIRQELLERGILEDRVVEWCK